MSAHPALDLILSELYALLRQWKELTTAESAAIYSENWDGLGSIQLEKSRLQPLIERFESELETHPELSPEDLDLQKRRLREYTEHLFELESQNRDVLGKEMAAADSQLKASNKAINRLRHVQRVYGQVQQSFWQSYS